MARPTTLITGGTGLLALNWACALRNEHDIVLGMHARRVDLARTRAVELPLDDAAALARKIDQIRPAVIVHTAGITSVEECEREPERARHVCEDLSLNVARAAKEAGARLIHISTDHLFAGDRSWYAEDATPQPLNAYGRAKLAAERAVASACSDALIVRTNFFGWGHRYRQSFSDWIHGALSAGRPLTMFDDVFVTPILADRLATHAHALAESGASGIYNVVGDERISKYDFAVLLAKVFGQPEALLQRGKLAASKISVERPSDMSLDNRKTQQRLGIPLGNVEEHLQLLRQQQHAGRPEELKAAVTE